MKKPFSEQSDTDMKPEYRFDYRKSRPNPFVPPLKAGDKVTVTGPPLNEPPRSDEDPPPPSRGPHISLRVGPGQWNRWRQGHPDVELTFDGLDLTGANLRGYDLSGLDLRRVSLEGATLRDANLSGSNLSEARLNGADLSGSDLSRADLSGATLDGADLTGADLTGTVLKETESFQADEANLARPK